jgi:hypothetical protein
VPTAGISNTSLTDIIGNTLVPLKQISFPHCGLSIVTKRKLIKALCASPLYGAESFSHSAFLKQKVFGFQISSLKI